MSPRVPQLPKTLRPTQHFRERAGERGLARDVEEFVVARGSAIDAGPGHWYLTIVPRDLPYELRDCKAARRAEGWVFVLADDGALLTCYRDFARLRKLRRVRALRACRPRAA